MNGSGTLGTLSNHGLIKVHCHSGVEKLSGSKVLDGTSGVVQMNPEAPATVVWPQCQNKAWNEMA